MREWRESAPPQILQNYFSPYYIERWKFSELPSKWLCEMILQFIIYLPLSVLFNVDAQLGSQAILHCMYELRSALYTHTSYADRDKIDSYWILFRYSLMCLPIWWWWYDTQSTPNYVGIMCVAKHATLL